MMRIVNGHVKCFESCLSRQVCRSLRFDLLRHSPTEGGSSQKDDALKLNRKCWPPCSESSTCILIIHTSWLQYIHGDRGHPSLLFLFFCFLLLLLFVFVFPPPSSYPIRPRPLECILLPSCVLKYWWMTTFASDPTGGDNPSSSQLLSGGWSRCAWIARALALHRAHL